MPEQQGRDGGSTVTYDVAVWDGDRPANAEAASDTLDRLLDAEEARAEAGLPQAPLSAGLDAFLSDLLDHWPEIDQPNGQNSPWAMSDLREDASGQVCYLCMTTSPLLDEAVAYIAALARKHGLVCFDPQVEEVIS